MKKEPKVTFLDGNMGVSPTSGVSLRNTYIAAVSAFTYITVMGLVIGYASSATVDMKKPGSRFQDVTADQISWIVSLPSLSGVIGNFLSGYFIQKLGRKAVLMFISGTYMVSWLTIVYANSVAFLYVGRLIAGFSCGMATVAVSAYVVEIAPTKIRGFLSSGFQVLYSVGVLIIMSLGVVLRWSWLALSAAVFVAISACMMLAMPESPVWLIRESRNLEAAYSLKFLRGMNADIAKEAQDIKENMTKDTAGGVTWRELSKPTLYKPLIIVFFLFFFGQLSGMAALISYTVDIFEKAGGIVDARVSAAVVAIVQLIATIMCSILIDRTGRKFLYIISGIFIFISLSCLAIYTVMLQKYDFDLDNYKWLPLLSFVVYIAAYSCGFGPIPFVMAPEFVPIHSRGVVLAVGTITCSLVAFIVAKTFDSVREEIGDYGMYFMYAISSLIGSIFCYLFVQETKGRSIRDINKSFEYKNNY
ncbi:facilitated trehalose transporter Tret1-like [Uloborus diversus]|uniref:facilitated trehalose transporter Tret1-like n=1 Tax=Uloborus diversus TaxID=327109 RepID=UPI0024097D3B|nr:facilitated trehalose transporter Tret1-like [Uloborus diversus]